MCKTYDAIFEIKKIVESDVLILWIDGAEIRGKFACDCDCGAAKQCQPDVVTLKDVKVKCKETGDEKTFKMLNVPSMWIKAFCFECCENK